MTSIPSFPSFPDSPSLSPEMKELMEFWEQMTRDTVNQGKQQSLIQMVGSRIGDAARDSFEKAGEALLGIQALNNAEAERKMGAPEASISLPEYHGTDNFYGGYETPSDPYGGVSGLDRVEKHAAYLGELVRRLDSGVKLDVLLDSVVDGIRVRDYLDANDIDTSAPQAIKEASKEAQATAAAFKKFVGEEFDVDAFLDALGERAGDYKDDAEAYRTAHLKTMNFENILAKFDTWKNLSKTKQNQRPIEHEFTKDELQFLKNEGIDIKADSAYEDIKAAHEQAHQTEADALQKLADHAGAVRPEDANPDNGNQWDPNNGWPEQQSAQMQQTSALQEAAALLDEDDADLDSMSLNL